jgi:hypothetical protein
VFNPEFTDSDNGTKLSNAVKTGKVGPLKVDENSFKVEGEFFVVVFLIYLRLVEDASASTLTTMARVFCFSLKRSGTGCTKGG